MLKTDIGEIIILDYSIAAKTFRKDKELESAVMAGEKAIAVLFKGGIAGYIASRNLLSLWNITPFVLPYGHIFLSHYGTLWENIDDNGGVFAFGEKYPIAIAASLFNKENVSG